MVRCLQTNYCMKQNINFPACLQSLQPVTVFVYIYTLQEQGRWQMHTQVWSETLMGGGQFRDVGMAGMILICILMQ
jgi:hypothetical protein